MCLNSLFQSRKYSLFKLILIFVVVLLVSCNGAKKKSDDQQQDSTSTPVNPIQNNHSNSEIKPGDFTEYHPNGAVKMKGIYNDSLQREGLWISYYDNGNKWSESYYTKGKKDGHSITFFPNGQIRYVGEYKNDLKTGTWTFYDEEGNISKEEKY